MSELNKIEEFRDIPGYEGMYQVSTFGRVKSLGRTTITKNNVTRYMKELMLKNGLDNDGYYHVGLYKNKKAHTIKVHKLMHRTFIDKFNQNKPCIDHIDHDTTNNHIDNLRECTIQENCMNRSKNSNETSSEYIGVHWYSPKKKWRCVIKIHKNDVDFGCFLDEIEAAKVHDSAAKYYHKEFASLNFPDDKTILPKSIKEIRCDNRKRRNLSSKYYGVNLNKALNKWHATIKIDNKTRHLGYYEIETEAAKAFDVAVIKYNRDYSKLNFKESL